MTLFNRSIKGEIDFDLYLQVYIDTLFTNLQCEVYIYSDFNCWMAIEELLAIIHTSNDSNAIIVIVNNICVNSVEYIKAFSINLLFIEISMY